MKFLLRLKIWFWSRKQVMDEIQSLTEMLESQMSKYIDKIEALEQGKIYSIAAEMDDVHKLQNWINHASKKIKWTLPPLVITNLALRKLSKEEITQFKKDYEELQKIQRGKTYSDT